jgi:hypothetical protein
LRFFMKKRRLYKALLIKVKVPLYEDDPIF